MPAELFPARPTSCGLPVINVEVCILGAENEKMPPGGVGEICFRGATIMQEQLEAFEELFKLLFFFFNAFWEDVLSFS